jgi:hypothetical protein
MEKKILTLIIAIGFLSIENAFTQSSIAPQSVINPEYHGWLYHRHWMFIGDSIQPTSALEVKGQITLRGGNPGINKILVSNANGLARWQSLTAGSGISITDSVITNTAPNIQITLTGQGATSVTGTYPNFTISSTDNNTTYTGGSGITVTGTTINSVWTKNGTHIYNNNTGNVGIGLNGLFNATPQNVLHIHSKSTQFGISGIQITHTQTGYLATDGLLIGFDVNSNRPNFKILSQENGSLQLGTNNAILLTLTPNGNTGIGVTSPTAKLHTNGTVRMENLTVATQATNARILLMDAQGNVSQAQTSLIGDNLGNHTATQNLKMNDQWISNKGSNDGIKISDLGDVLIYGKWPSGGQKTYEQNNGFEIVTCGRIPERRGISVDDDPSGNVNFWLQNWQNPAAFNFNRNDVGSVKQLVTITKEGKVGIGKNNPTDALLHIANIPQNTAGLFVGNNPYQNEGLAFLNTADAAHEWVRGEICHGYASNASGWQITSPNNYGGIRFANRGIAFIAGSADNQTLQTPMWIDNSGKVGIGTTNPSSSLDVKLPANVLDYSIAASFKSNDEHGNIVIVPKLCDGGYNWLSTEGDMGIFWNDRLAPNSKNLNAGFVIAPWENNLAGIRIMSNGNVGIGVANPNAKLQVNGNTYIQGKLGIGICLSANNNPKNYTFAVNGIMGAKDVYIEVDETPWPDYVLESQHQLLSLSELETYIKLNKHLPDIPTAQEIKENGLSLAEINAQLLQKIEELTLYIIELNKKIEKYEKR